MGGKKKSVSDFLGSTSVCSQCGARTPNALCCVNCGYYERTPLISIIVLACGIGLVSLFLVDTVLQRFAQIACGLLLVLATKWIKDIFIANPTIWMLRDANKPYELVRVLNRLLDDNTLVIVRPVVEALLSLRTPEAEQALLSLLQKSGKRMRAEIIDVLGTLGQQAIPPLLSARNIPELAAAAQEALDRNTSAYVGPIVVSLDDPDPHVRIEAIRFLGVMQDANSVEPLLAFVARLTPHEYRLGIEALNALTQSYPGWMMVEAAQQIVPTLLTFIQQRELTNSERDQCVKTATTIDPDWQCSALGQTVSQFLDMHRKQRSRMHELIVRSGELNDSRTTELETLLATYPDFADTSDLSDAVHLSDIKETLYLHGHPTLTADNHLVQSDEPEVRIVADLATVRERAQRELQRRQHQKA